MRKVGVVGGLAAVAVLAVAAASAQALTLEPIGPGGYDNPTFVTSDPRDPDRLFVVEQSGLVKVTTPAGTSTFLDLTAESADAGEQGVWSIAFAPDFAASGRLYVAYSANDGALTLDEYRERPSPSETEATRRNVLSIPNNPLTTNHNGGQLAFGPDGLLYWSTGDDAQRANAQSRSTLLGKLLRIDPRGAGPGEYAVPADNPFVGVPGNRSEIWALGLRNPWRFSFDRATGALVIADVGENTWEEVDYASRAAGGGAGRNYGWPCFEGVVPLDPCTPPPPAIANPIYTYESNGGACSITGGHVVRDPDLGDLVGRYLFADFCEGELRSIDPLAPPAPNGDRREGVSVAGPSSFGEDACGRLYVVARGAGQVYRLEGPSGGACPRTPPPAAPADTEAPDTRIKLRRKNRRGTKWVAKLRASEPGATFECRLDKRRWKPCKPKHRLLRLRPGRHRLRARATDPAGNTDPTPAKRKLRTKRKAGTKRG